MKKKISIFSLLVSIISCSSLNQKDIDISDYYFNINEFNPSKIYQYRVEENGVQSYVYNKMSKISDNDLLIEQYDETFEIGYRTLSTFTSKGVFFKEFWLPNSQDNGNLFPLSIIDSLVFPFNLKYGPAKSKTKGTFNKVSNITFTTVIDFSEPTDTTINQQNVNILYGRAKRTVEIKSLKEPLNSRKIETSDLIIYQKDLGIIQINSNYSEGTSSVMRLVKILDIEEFERMKNDS